MLDVGAEEFLHLLHRLKARASIPCADEGTFGNSRRERHSFTELLLGLREHRLEFGVEDFVERVGIWEHRRRGSSRRHKNQGVTDFGGEMRRENYITGQASASLF